jgi:hypothetical protein
MERLAETVLVARLGEKQHLVPSFRAAAAEPVASIPGAVLVPTEVPFMVGEWPIRNYVDVGVRVPGMPPLWIELKWGDHKMGEAVWDISKVALGIEKNAASSALLIAGASSQRWARGTVGAEFFSEGTWPLTHIRSPAYVKGYWQPYVNEELPQPTQLPRSIITRPVASVPLTLSGQPWELRCTEVVPGPDGLEPIAPLEAHVRA